VGAKSRRAVTHTPPYVTDPFHTARDSGDVCGTVETTRTAEMRTTLPEASVLVDETLQVVAAATAPDDAARLAALEQLRGFSLGEP